ncbi:efflux RND transporter periplasmic adaptor subunit [Enterovirga rhinocerotis]|uniref:Membrane fusion protein (Multidrug efflux system) n=1 Tax=Enterovirga rhinocerotis TaxID=1339210 RepID=A0A4R7BKW2_9HYPH|nr:efflux RND transporter periplasmic adaptor subunit [Enterovirga rhinocerotis]TDR84507.1 membrane fusion protein (multidrug efflux system) [Enterovirga rhinocerotis]
MSRHVRRFLPLAASCLALALASCQPASQDQSGAETPPIQVASVNAQAATVPMTMDLPGRLASTRVAEVRAQVAGIVQERAFVEGATVKRGDVLFRIDPAVYNAELDARAAALARAEATRVLAKRAADRVDTLIERQVASSAQNDVAVATLRQAEADVAAAKAQLDRARINLDYATVRAPIDGRIGRALVTEGALVGQNDATHLATVQQIDPIYADFAQPASDPGLAERTASGPTEVRLVDILGEPFGDTGRLLFSDVTVDPGTGQVSLRATLPNTKGTLLPGTYVRVRVPRGVKSGAVLVPAQAIQRSSAGEAQAYVVEEGGRLALRPLRTGALTEAGWLVEEGLEPGETVVVEGFQKIRPGATVAPVPWKPAPERPVPTRPDR